MGLLRSMLLAGSESRWLRDRATRLPFVRRAVNRFMPGEQLDAALAAAEGLRERRIAVVLTELGENVTDAGEAEAVARRYLAAIPAMAVRRLDGQISIKLTQLGLDLDEAMCLRHVQALVACAAEHRSYVWIDMEQFRYVDRTLDVYRRARAESPNVGVCLQAYLYRTPEDLESLLRIGAGIRLVKGAYREPETVAYPKKADVDRSFFALATRMISAEARAARCWPVFGTHDRRLIDAIRSHAAANGVGPEAYEFDLLFGIQRAEQERLAAMGHRVRVLISFGRYWFPWYMRRLAERPANLWFVVRSAFAR